MDIILILMTSNRKREQESTEDTKENAETQVRQVNARSGQNKI